MNNQIRIVIVFSLLVFFSGQALAQSSDAERVRVSFAAGTTAGALDGELSLGASAGYRFSEHFTFEVEMSMADDAADRFSNRVFGFLDDAAFGRSRFGDVISRFGTGFRTPIGLPIGPISIDSEGSTWITTAGFRYELPVQGTRFRPYVSGGLGVAYTEESIEVDFNATSTSSGGRPGTTTTTSISALDESLSHTGIALSGGVGASLRVFKQLWADLNVRYYRLDRDRNLGSFGGGVSYRF